jgi:hypothetical protein
VPLPPGVEAAVRDAGRGPASEAAAALVAIACVSCSARAAVAASGLLDQVLYHLGAGASVGGGLAETVLSQEQLWWLLTWWGWTG